MCICIGVIYDIDLAAWVRMWDERLPCDGISNVGQIVLLTQPDTGNRTDSERRDRRVVENDVGYQGASKTPHEGHYKGEGNLNETNDRPL